MGRQKVSKQQNKRVEFKQVCDGLFKLNLKHGSGLSEKIFYDLAFSENVFPVAYADHDLGKIIHTLQSVLHHEKDHIRSTSEKIPWHTKAPHRSVDMPESYSMYCINPGKENVKTNFVLVEEIESHLDKDFLSELEKKQFGLKIEQGWTDQGKVVKIAIRKEPGAWAYNSDNLLDPDNQGFKSMIDFAIEKCNIHTVEFKKGDLILACNESILMSQEPFETEFGKDRIFKQVFFKKTI